MADVTVSLSHGFRSDILLILLFASAAIAVLYFLGMILIQSIMLVSNIAIVPAILSWEKNSRKKSAQDKKLDEKRSEIKRIQKRISASKDISDKRILLARRRVVENELRLLKWSTSERDLGQEQRDTKDDSSKSRTVKPNLPKFTPQLWVADDVQQRASDEKRKHLEQILSDAQDLLTKEPAKSAKFAIHPLAGELRARYNAMKKWKTASDGLLGDYWASWAALYSISRNIRVNPSLERYVSDGFRPKFSAFVRFTRSRRSSSRQTKRRQ